MRLARSGSLAAACIVLSLSGGARAHGSKVYLSMTSCSASGISTARLVELASSELAPQLLVLDDGSPKNGELQVAVQLCQGSPDYALLALGIPGRPAAARFVNLSDVVDDMRARTLAVALAEFVTAAPTIAPATVAVPANTAPVASAQVLTNPARAAPLKTDAALTLDRQATAPAATSPTRGNGSCNGLSAGLTLRDYVAQETRLLGPWLSMAGNGWLGEAQFLVSNSDQSRGTVSVYNANLAAAYELAGWGQQPHVALRLRGELGWVWAQGVPLDPTLARGSTKSAPQSALLLEMLLKGSISRNIGIETRLDIGAASGLTAEADKRAVATTNGFLVGGAIGVAYDWGDTASIQR